MKTETNPAELWRIPSKNYIKALVDKYIKSLDIPDHTINKKAITFNDAFMEEGKSTVILWKAYDCMRPMIGFDVFLEEHGFKVKIVKYWGEVHSIWLDCKIDPESVHL